MKSIIISLFLLVSVSIFAQENVSFTVRASPGVDNKAKVFIRSNADKSGVVTQILLTFLVPAAVMPTPTATFAPTANFTHLGSFPPEPVYQQVVAGTNYNVYTFSNVYAGTMISNLVINTEYELGEVTFNYGGFTETQLRLAYLPDGGNSGLSGLALELAGNQIGNNPAIVYGPGSTNAGSGSGFSFVGANILLPVNFKSFYALKSGDDAKLTWDISSDDNNSHFQVLRSTDGRNFKSVQRINALGNGNSDNTYETVDFSLSKIGSRDIYYQIQQFDKDGQNTKSAVRMLSVDGLGKAVTAFPNPARTSTKLVVDAPEAGRGSIIMRDAIGRQVQVINAEFHRGINNYDLNVMNLSSGDYNIQVSGGGLKETIKLTKIN